MRNSKQLEAYYQDNDSPLTDLEYDQSSTKFGFGHKTGYVLPDSVTQGVGSLVTGSKLPKVEHKDKVPWSLDKTKDTGFEGFIGARPDGEVGVLFLEDGRFNHCSNL